MWLQEALFADSNSLFRKLILKALFGVQNVKVVQHIAVQPLILKSKCLKRDKSSCFHSFSLLLHLLFCIGFTICYFCHSVSRFVNAGSKPLTLTLMNDFIPSHRTDCNIVRKFVFCGLPFNKVFACNWSSHLAKNSLYVIDWSTE